MKFEKINLDKVEKPKEGEDFYDFENSNEFGGRVINIEDIPNESLMVKDKDGNLVESNEIENQTEEALLGKFKNLEDGDVYDFAPIIDRLFRTLKKKNKGEKDWKNKRECNRLFDKVNVFITEYRKILSEKFSAEKEYKLVRNAFKKIIGEVVYIDNDLEILKPFIRVRNSHASQEKENKNNGVKNELNSYKKKYQHNVNIHGYKAYNSEANKTKKLNLK